MKILTSIFALTLFTSSAVLAAGNDHFLADRHIERGLKCESCHTTQPPKAVPTSQCQSCHGGYDKLAKLTDKKDINPHDSHVENPACGDCHHGHRKPALLCDQCHQFDNIKVP